MRLKQFESLEAAISCYGRDSLIPIDNLSQIIFYTAHGCQPKFVFENELKPGKLTAWFHRGESADIYQEWLKNGKRRKTV